MFSRITYALGGLLFGVTLIVVFELTLRLFGVAENAPKYDPFAGFSRAVPLFEQVAERDGTRFYEWSSLRARHYGDVGKPEPQRTFSIRPGEDVYRIFVTGGSSAAGTPYTTDFAFSGWLEQALGHQISKANVDVVNTAMPAYGSGRLLPIVEELAGYEPDLLILYMGHNEWAESAYHSGMMKIPPPVFRVLEAVYSSRIYGLAAILTKIEPPRPDEIEIDIQRQNQQMFQAARERIEQRQHSPEREVAYRELIYRRRVHSMIDAMEAVGARVMLLTLAQNFADWAPPASIHREGLDDVSRRRFAELLAEGDRLAKAQPDCASALDRYRGAIAIDDEHAGAHYALARCLHARGDLAAARSHYRRASDLDPVPFGAPTRFNEILREIAEERGTLFVDVDRALTELSGTNAVGDDLFTDFAHPNIRAHQHIAAEIAAALRAAEQIAPAEDWGTSYVPPSAESLHAADPDLARREVQCRVVTCLTSDRAECESDARELLSFDPSDRVGRWVMSNLRSRGLLQSQRSAESGAAN